MSQRSARLPRRLELDDLTLTRLRELVGPHTPDHALRLRAQIILSWHAGMTAIESAEHLGVSRKTVGKWRSRFNEVGVEGLYDRPRRGAPSSISAARVSEVLRLLRDCQPPRGKARWTTRMVAQKTGLSQSTVVRINRSHI